MVSKQKSKVKYFIQKIYSQKFDNFCIRSFLCIKFANLCENKTHLLIQYFGLCYDRTKLKQTEVDCEFLKRCCENLTEENRRLQKEVQELRALKLSPQFYMQMAPPTTLTMCPSCERVGAPTVDSRGQRSQAGAGRPKPVSDGNHWAAAGARQFDAIRPRS
ncbi:hypothetical protein QQ045_019311 [Rhodiola kirilowii]